MFSLLWNIASIGFTHGAMFKCSFGLWVVRVGEVEVFTDWVVFELESDFFP